MIIARCTIFLSASTFASPATIAVPHSDGIGKALTVNGACEGWYTFVMKIPHLSMECPCDALSRGERRLAGETCLTKAATPLSGTWSVCSKIESGQVQAFGTKMVRVSCSDTTAVLQTSPGHCPGPLNRVISPTEIFKSMFICNRYKLRTFCPPKKKQLAESLGMTYLLQDRQLPFRGFINVKFGTGVKGCVVELGLVQADLHSLDFFIGFMNDAHFR